MERWEIILSMYVYEPNIARYKCKECGRLFKTDKGIYEHIDNSHNQVILDKRDAAIIKEIV